MFNKSIIRKPLTLLPEARQFKAILEYTYGLGVADLLPWDELKFVRSRRSQRLKHVKKGGRIFATIKEDGTLALSMNCMEYLYKTGKLEQFKVVASDIASEFVSKGGNLFCRHVLSAGREIRPGMDVPVTDKKGNLIATGKAVLPYRYMTVMKRGLAVKVRDAEQNTE